MSSLRSFAPFLRLAPALAVLAATACLASAAPATAGGLDGFLKKGGKQRPSNSDSDSSSSSGSSGSSGRLSDSGSGVKADIWGKHPRTDPQPTRPEREDAPRKGGVLDVLRKDPRRPTADPGRPGEASPGDVLRRPDRRQTKRPPAGAVPVVVAYHYHDPRYHPYDRVFHDHCRDALDRFPWCYGPAPDPERYTDEQAEDALRDIEEGWLRRDLSLIGRHVAEDEAIRVFQDGQYSHSLSAPEFRALTQQALSDLRTIRLRFTYRQMLNGVEVRAAGLHVFVGPDGRHRQVVVAYTLGRANGRWLIRSVELGQ